jgi:hypothetical protein
MSILVPKLSPRSMGWTKAIIATAVADITDKDKIFIGRVAGIVTGFKETLDEKTGNIQLGLKGSFKALGNKPDENGVLPEVRSGVCYLPGGIQETVEAAFTEARGSGENERKGATVAFAVDLYVRRANNAAGYSYEAETLMQPQENDPLAMLFADAANAKPVPALPAPAPAAAPAKGAEKAKAE